MRLSMLPLFLGLLAGCSGSNAAPAPEKPAEKPAAPAKPAPPPAEPATAPASTPTSTEPAAGGTAAATPPRPELLAPEKATEKAPATYKAKFETTKGDFVIDVTRAWAPEGADRFYNLVKIGFFDDVAFFRVVDGFMVQFGISGMPEVSTKWRNAKIPDDPVTQSNTRGMVTFATSGANSRTSQVFINFADRNTFLDGSGFAPFGKVSSGMDIVDALYKGYGEGAPKGRGPSQGRIQSDGNTYLKAEFPKLDYVKKAEILK
jgi:peptidyl-prolyl cis-trans isomerase A (cyclophilin A)